MGAPVVLGVDLASKRWRDVGAALVTLDVSSGTCSAAVTGLREPEALTRLEPSSLADAIDAVAVDNGVVAVSIDGPQGWRDPDRPESEGVGRACERSAHTPGKTAAFGRTYPANQIDWISFSIEVFELLLRRPHAHLVNDPATTALPRLGTGEYHLMECFPTVTWRSSGLTALPAKAKRPNTDTFANALATVWPFSMQPTAIGHDDLQAIVAALPAVALLGLGRPLPHGQPARLLAGRDGTPTHRAEGIIWDASLPRPWTWPERRVRAHDTFQPAARSSRPLAGQEIVITVGQWAGIQALVSRDATSVCLRADRAGALNVQVLDREGAVITSRLLPPA